MPDLWSKIWNNLYCFLDINTHKNILPYLNNPADRDEMSVSKSCYSNELIDIRFDWQHLFNRRKWQFMYALIFLAHAGFKWQGTMFIPSKCCRFLFLGFCCVAGFPAQHHELLTIFTRWIWCNIFQDYLQCFSLCVKPFKVMK